MMRPSSNKENLMTTLKALRDKIAKLQAQAEIAKKENSVVVKRIADLMEKHGLTTDDIAVGLRKAARSKATVAKIPAIGPAAAKYLNRETGATWSGRGRAPAWIVNAEDRSEFLVKRGNTATGSAKKAPKAKKHVRGAQALVYRDPKTGSTWSGGGRAPEWLATAKNPIEYLIPKNQASLASAESMLKLRTVNKPSAKAASVASQGNSDGHGDRNRQTSREEPVRSNADYYGMEGTPEMRNTIAKMFTSPEATVENIAEGSVSAVEEAQPVGEQDVTSELPQA
jgi:DNA-binding protein H-NS